MTPPSDIVVGSAPASAGGRWWRWVLAAAGMLVARAVADVLPAGLAQRLTADLTELGQSALAALLCWWAARRWRPEGRALAAGWALLGAAFASWSLGDALYTAMEWSGWASPVTAAPDALYLAFYPLFLLGVINLPRARFRAGEHPVLLLDSAVVVVGSAILLWTLLVQPDVRSGAEVDTATLAIGLAYPVGDLVALWAGLTLLFSRRDAESQNACRWLVLALAVMIAIDVVYCHQLVTGTYVSGNWLGLGWCAGNGLAAVAAAWRLGHAPAPLPVTVTRRRPLLGPLLLAWATLAAAWVAVACAGFDSLAEPAPLGLSAMIVLVLVRMVFSALDTHRLNAGLRQANEELEARVHERTAALGEANAILRAEIAERAQAEQALRASEARFRRLFDACPVGLALWDRDGVIHGANPRLVELVGATRAEVEDGRLVWRRLDPAGSPDFHQALARCTDGEPREAELLAADGRRVPVLMGTVPIGDLGEGRFSTAVVDLTDRRRLEADLEKARQMEALGVVAGGVAHDFNNLLTVAMGHTELVLPTMPDGTNRRCLEAAHDAARRASDLARQLLTFARMGRRQPVVVDLVALVAKAEPLLLRVAGGAVQIDLDLPAAPVSVVAEPSELDQLLLNLVVNARDAMPQGGRITIAVEIEHADGAWAVIEVADTGEGMDEATRARCLEPFFTTKGPGRGTGLGLAIVNRVVRGVNGRIAIASQPGQGTTFRMHLPLMRPG